MADADMSLPEGMTCRDCYQWKRCEGFLSLKGPETSCDWAPSRFAPSMELVGRLSRERAEARAEVDDLMLELARTREAATIVQQDAAALRAELKGCEEELAHTVEGLSRSAAKRLAAEAERDGFRGKLTNATGRETALLEENADLRAQVETLQGRIDAVRRAIERLRTSDGSITVRDAVGLMRLLDPPALAEAGESGTGGGE